MVKRYALNCNISLTHSEKETILRLLSKERKNRVASYRFEKDAIQSMLSGLLLKYILKQEGFGAECNVSYNEYKKPYVDCTGLDHADFFFNISHSKDWIVCGTSTKEIGIDIEKISTCHYDIAQRFFHQDEYHELLSRPQEMQAEVFYTYWTLKESFVKYIGKGIYIPLNEFLIQFPSLQIDASAYTSKPLHLFTQTWEKQYQLSLCTEETEVLPVEVLDLDQMLAFFNF